MDLSRRASTLSALAPADQERLLGVAREVSFARGDRLFAEGGRADRFWVIRSGTVVLDLRVPGRRAAAVETLGPGQLLGCSWLFAPHVWHLGAEAQTPVRAYEFVAAEVLALCRQDTGMGMRVAEWVGGIVTHRLHSARTRLLDLYAPYGSGSTL